MVDMVSAISPVQNAVLTPSAQNSGAAASSAPVPASDVSFVTSSIYVDNLQNVAILQYRSESGEVIQQYPNQSQIKAFKAAERLAEQVKEQPSVTTQPAAHSTTAAVHVATTQPTPAAPAPAAAPSNQGAQTTSVVA